MIRLEKIRRKLYQSKNGKNPTDIIIFTDSYSYSATSVFIKGFQNNGGAIIVGYNGNPKKGIELFDASHSPTSVVTFEKTKEYANLDSLGFQVSISHGETFDEDYKKPNPIPREYKVDPIDERSDILEAYTDDTYQLFLDEAKRYLKNIIQMENVIRIIHFYYLIMKVVLSKKMNMLMVVILVVLMENGIKINVKNIIVILDIFIVK